MKRRFPVTLVLFLAAICASARAQDTKTIAERLGYPRDAKLLIVHGDDIGMSHSVNAASIAALESGAINSGSIMVPCPWFPEIADYLKSHPDADLGLHLTMTSERVYVRWGPVASKDTVPSLVDADGYFHLDWPAGMKIDAREVEREIRAQVERALAMGVRPTHFDSHQYRLFENGKDIFEAALRVAQEYKIPLLVPIEWAADYPYLKSSTRPRDILVEHVVSIAASVPAEKWNDFYVDALKKLQPGVTEFIIHVAYDNEEMQAMTRERATWGAAWRQRDFDYFTSPAFRKLLQEQNIKLVNWRELGKAQKP